mmetsp:Transcript_70723/g.165866  ORF Transcript_70723/g.165866 Transcript_70723/m.165866 type:complete len:292 (+) Transcript_70723:6412-7287(+)
MPLSVTCAIHMLGVQQRHRVIEPLQNRLILDRIKPHLNGFQGLNVQNVVSIVQGGLLVIERRESHALEVASVSLLTAHHNPHGTPLGQVHGLDNLLHLRAEGNGPAAVIDSAAVADLLPRHRGVFQELVHGVRKIFESTQIDTLVMTELARRHVSVVLDDLPDVLRRHLFLLLLNHSKLALLTIALGVQGLPLSSLLIQQLLLGLVGRHRRLGGLGCRRGLWRQSRSSSRLCHLLLLLLQPWHSRRQREGVDGQAGGHLPGHPPLPRKIEHGCHTDRSSLRRPVYSAHLNN